MWGVRLGAPDGPRSSPTPTNRVLVISASWYRHWPRTSRTPSSDWRSMMASGRPGKSSAGPGTLAACMAGTSVGLDHFDDVVTERARHLGEPVRHAGRDDHDVAPGQPLGAPATRGGGPVLAGADLPAVDHLATGHHGRLAVEDVHGVRDPGVELDLAGAGAAAGV